ncbi:sensor histidine kinase KdpD [uncultured Bacteroides sp.]|uniref:sensor histidine kinase n=1 Tax=uncultured Bacteroides sp. TaxID=162156 RepID=UPI0026119472|nr:HAMP domain-containing sensor histidine kinase [uncultured Bacteroides sp.]
MKLKNIWWIAIVGLVAIVELQYIWLTNTYKLTRDNVQVQSDNLFCDATLMEVFGRIHEWKLRTYGSHRKVELSFEMKVYDDSIPPDPHEDNERGYREEINRMVLAAFQEKVAKRFNKPLDLQRLDSIYSVLLDSVGIHAEIATCVTDTLGNLLQSSRPIDWKNPHLLKTVMVPMNLEESVFVQGVITNPYEIVFRHMTLLLLATVLVMILVICCIVYQIRIILRQDKIAKVREDFSYAMIHDMKTPLSSIVMGTQVLESGRLDNQPEKKARYFRILKEEGEHLITLTNKILTISKLENHQLKLVKAPCALRPMLEDLADKYKEKATKQVIYHWDLQQETVYADEEFLKEALSNLIDNALKYSGDAVEITFSSAALPDGKDVIRVRDNGFGIPLKDRSRIFEKYERASAAGRSRTGGAPGFGLGLNYVLRVVEAHGGKVEVDSIEGEYSEFSIILPKEDKTDEAVADK